MEPGIPLVVPEINAGALSAETKIIANPNCSTIQLVMVLKPLHDLHPIEAVRVSTYQSVTGTGKAAVDQLENERRGIFDGPMAYAHPIDLNCIPHCDAFLDNGYTKEEMKLHHETKKILGDPRVLVSATAVRVPVQGGHSESVLITFQGARPSLPAVRQILAAMPGLVVQDDPANLSYPMPRNAEGRDEVFVGRIREDLVCNRSIHLWIVADNLRKGAATNAVQIAEHLVSAGFLQTPLLPGH
jgi:aspartate-semialdehyde dehydrogenase